jgi:hypothetical protein
VSYRKSVELLFQGMSFFDHISKLASSLPTKAKEMLRSRLEQNGICPKYLLDNLLSYAAWKLAFPGKTYVLDELKRFDYLMQGNNFESYRAAWERVYAVYERELKPLGGLATSYEQSEQTKSINKWALALLAMLAGALTSTLLYAASRPRPLPERLKPLDSDNDGLDDWDEQKIYGTNPYDWDSDDDALSDHDEVKIHKTNPLKADSDGDGLKDGEEVNVYETNPLSPDSDEDGWNDYEEIYLLNTNPMKRNRYEIAKRLLGEKLAVQLHLAAGDENFREAIEALKDLSDDCKELLYESRVVEEVAKDGILTQEELELLSDLDKDTLLNTEDAFPFNPLNNYELKDETRLWILRTSYWNLTNPSLTEIYGEDALRLAIDALEEGSDAFRRAAANFSFRQAHIYANLSKYLPELFDHELAVWASVNQIDALAYSKLYGEDQALYEVKGEDYLWSEGIRPAILFIDKLEDVGEIDCLDYDDWEWYTSDLISKGECVGQILLPFELVRIKIDTGDVNYVWEGPEALLQYLIHNVTSKEELGGRSPQEWLRDILVESMEKRDECYEEALWYGKEFGPFSVWQNSTEYFKQMCEEFEEKDLLPILIRGYPSGIRECHMPEPSERFGEPAYPMYSILVGRCLGRAVFEVDVPYPSNEPGRREIWHSEAAILTPWGKQEWMVPYGFCFYMDKEAFIRDYEGRFQRPYAVMWVQGERRAIDLED